MIIISPYTIWEKYFKKKTLWLSYNCIKKVYCKHEKPYPSFEQKRKEEGINDMRTLLLQHFSPCTYHAILIWRHRMNGLICIIFQAKPPLNLGRGRSRECHVITPQPIQVSLIMQKHDFGLFNVVRRARHGGRSKHLGVPVITEGHFLRKKFLLPQGPNIWGTSGIPRLSRLSDAASYLDSDWRRYIPM